MHRKLPIVLLAALLLLPAARAGTALRLGLAELSERCELAFEGRVLSATARRVGARRIETEYVVATARTFVGEPCALQVVRLPGGVLPDGSGLALAGMPRLDVGEDVVVFLSGETASGARMPVGLAQGKLRVVVQPDGAKRLVGDAAGLALVGAPGTALPPGVGIDYTAALAEIDAGIAARAARPSGERHR